MVRFGMAAAVLALAAAPLFAQESTEQLKKELEQLRAEVDGLKAVNQTREIPASGKAEEGQMAPDGDSPVMTLFKSTKLSGYVDAGYVLDLNHASGFGQATNNAPGNPFRAFDKLANSFYLNSVELNLERLASKDMIVGYHFGIAAGHDFAVYDPSASNVGLAQGWLQILAPLGSGLDIRVGKMATLIGYEVVDAKDDMNYSRGLLWTNIQPTTTTGVRMAYNFNEMISMTFGLDNGRNQASTYEDNNHGKGIEWQLLAKPIKDLMVSATLNVAFSDSAVASHDKTYLFDIVAEYKLDKLTVALNFDWAGAQGVLGANRDGASGLAIYGKYQMNDWCGTAVRVEYFSDQHGAIVPPAPQGGRIVEFTLTEEFKIAQQLIFRFEIRHDDVNQRDLTRNANTAKGDNSLGFEVIMPF